VGRLDVVPRGEASLEGLVEYVTIGLFRPRAQRTRRTDKEAGARMQSLADEVRLFLQSGERSALTADVRMSEQVDAGGPLLDATGGLLLSLVTAGVVCGH